MHALSLALLGHALRRTLTFHVLCLMYNLAQDMPRPFNELKALDIEELAQLITADGAAKA